MNTIDGPFWGMHMFWWFFWVLMMVSVFGFNLPERTRINSLDPHLILRRRLAKGDITEDEYNKIAAQLQSNENSVERDLTTQTRHAGLIGHPVTDGLSFSATWGIMYSLCAALYAVAPEAILSATSKLFHGMSFTQMAQTGTSFSFGDFVSVLTIGAVYTFVAGMIWSLIHTYSLRQTAERRLKSLENQTIKKTQITTNA